MIAIPEFRAATVADIPSIRSMVEKIWPLTYGDIIPAAQIDYMIAWMYDAEKLAQQMDTGNPFIMAIYEGAPVGFAAYSPLSETGSFHLDKLYLLPEIQGKGMGKKLLQEVITGVRKQGGNKLLLHVNRKNNASLFYSGMGFVIIREEDNDIGEGYFMNDYVMQLDL